MVLDHGYLSTSLDGRRNDANALFKTKHTNHKAIDNMQPIETRLQEQSTVSEVQP